MPQQTRWQQIMCLCDAIAQEFHPDKIVLFGSYASGKPRPDSDVDLLVVMPFEGSPFHQAAVILGHVVRTVGVLPMDRRAHDGAGARALAHGRQLYA